MTAFSPVVSAPPLRVLQIGKSWFPEQKGSGLDRMYHGLFQSLPGAGVAFRGLVAGRATDTPGAAGRVTPFASDRTSLPRRMMGARSAIRSVLQTEDVDLVASHFALYTFPALDLLADRPLVVHFHGPWAHESAVEGSRDLVVRTKKGLERAVYQRGTRFIVLSEAFREILCTEYGVAPDRVEIVPGGVDADRFDTGFSPAEARTRLGWPVDRPIVLTVRRLAHRMGLQALVEAMKAVRRQVPDVLLLIAGSGPLADELNAQIEAEGLQEHARLLGFVPDADLPLAYRAADVSIVPTTALEGFGLTTVESLAAGTPVLVSPRGGLPEVVRELSEDLILPDPSPASIAGGLVAALTGSTLPSAEECQSYARSRFDWPVIARQTRAVYETLL
jgi:glycosyltransferase involved in cell wall biosynthesis